MHKIKAVTHDDQWKLVSQFCFLKEKRSALLNFCSNLQTSSIEQVDKLKHFYLGTGIYLII